MADAGERATLHNIDITSNGLRGLAVVLAVKIRKRISILFRRLL